MTDEANRYRGAQADHELRETNAAFEQVRAGLVEAWATSTLGDAEAREKLYLSVQLLDAVRNELMKVATSKPMAESDDLIANIMAGRDDA